MAKKLRTDAKHGSQDQIMASLPNIPPTNKFSLISFRTQAIILAIIGFIFYCNTFSNEYAFDDMMAIVDNEYVQQGVSGIPDILTRDAYQSYLEHKNGSNQLAGGRYRPLSLVSFAIEQQFLGINNESGDAKTVKLVQDMHARHVVNVLLYILSVIVLLYFLRKIVFPDNPLIAFIAALIFTVHPIHTEVVGNVKSRDEILSVLFICLTFIKAFRYRESKKMKDLLFALLCFFLALLSKEYATTLLLLLPLAFYLFRKETISSSLKTTIPYLIPFALYLLLRLSAVTAMADGAENSIMNNPYLFAAGTQRIATQISVLLDYLKLLIIPSPLSSDYSYNAIPYTDFSNPSVWLSLFVYLGLIGGMCVLFIKRHALCFAIAVYLANLALISNFFFNIGAPMGERLIYHSSIGFAMAMAYLIYRGFAQIRSPVISKAGLAGFMGIIILLSCFKTTSRNRDWKNDETLFMTDVRTVPNSVLANNNAAASCMNYAKRNAKDVPVRNEWFQKAIRYFDKAISVYPQHTLSYLNRGLCYFDMGTPEKALPDWDSVRKYNPNEQNLSKYLSIAGRYFYSRGNNYMKANELDSAIFEFEKCAEATPGIPDAWYYLGTAYYSAGNIPEAKTSLGKALQIAPNYADAKKLYDMINSTPEMK